MTKNKLKSVAVGVPAYNEELSIKQLIESLLTQQQKDYYLKQIIVISDCSTDNTDTIVRSFKDHRIKLIRNKERKGKPLSQNAIFEKSHSDYLVILDADVVIKNDLFLYNMVLPLMKDPQVGLVGAKVVPLSSTTFIEKVINHSAAMKQEIAEEFNNADNIFLCHGRGRAFSKSLADKFKFVSIAGEDAYSYLQCKFFHYKFVFAKNARVYYRSPQSLKDHFKQSMRYFNGRKTLEEYFSHVIVFENFNPPKTLLFRKLYKYFVADPILLLSYLAILSYSKINSQTKKMGIGMWEMSTSSKKL